jgi:hypothetical protein
MPPTITQYYCMAQNIIASTSSNGQRIDWLTSEWAAFCVHGHVQQIITSNLCWTSPNLTVPHLLVELGTMPGTDRLLLYLAMVPKRDVSYEYVTTYYSKRPSTTVPRSWEELAAHCLMIPGWTAWRSKTASVNCMGAGLACAHLIPAADVEMAGDIAMEAVNLWLGFLCSATPSPAGENVMAMATRDAGLRRMNTYGDPYFQALKEVVGGDAWDAMSGLISKGEEEYGIV